MICFFFSLEPFSTPNNIHLARVDPGEMVFSWNQTQNCPSIYYNLTSTNCGNCPDTTNENSVVCFNFTTSDSVTICIFMVQVVICSNSDAPIVGNPSNSITVNLTGKQHLAIVNACMHIHDFMQIAVPAIREVVSVPHYHIDNGLQGLTVFFSTVVSHCK